MEVILPRATLHREEILPRRKVRLPVTLQPTLQEVEILLELGTLLATHPLTLQVTLLEERVSHQIGVGTLPLEHLQVEAALPVIPPHTLLVELILPAIHLRTLQKEEILLDTLPPTLLGVEKPQVTLPHMHQRKETPQTSPQLILLKVEVQPLVILPHMPLKVLVPLLMHLQEAALPTRSQKKQLPAQLQTIRLRMKPSQLLQRAAKPPHILRRVEL